MVTLRARGSRSRTGAAGTRSRRNPDCPAGPEKNLQDRPLWSKHNVQKSSQVVCFMVLRGRVLANECSHGNRKLACFMRKGADILCKWVGESEQQQWLLFEQAYHKRFIAAPSCRRCWLDGQAEVVVIGAINWLDCIYLALRRPAVLRWPA